MTLKVEVLRQSFDQVKPNATAFAASFYEQLFADNPQLRPLFAGTDMAAQEQKLIQSLVLVIENLRNPTLLVTAVRGLGTRHLGYGVTPEHYPMVGGALLKTFAVYLGEDWQPAVEQAWVDAYGVITDLMIEGEAGPA